MNKTLHSRHELYTALGFFLAWSLNPLGWTQDFGDGKQTSAKEQLLEIAHPRNRTVAVETEGYYCNGQRRVFAGDPYYPNGQRVLFAGDFYYPNKQRVTFAGDIYYPNAQRLLFAGDQYYMSGRRVLFAGDFYYPNGQRVLYAGDCYWQNGRRMDACPPTVRYVERAGAFKAAGALDLKQGLGGNISFEVADAKVTTYFDLDLNTGDILNVDAFCE